MKKSVVAVMMVFASVSQASDYGPWPTAMTYATSLFAAFSTVFPTILTQCSGTVQCHNWKVIVAAQEDAAVYVATEGQVMGVNLAQALDVLRPLPEAQNASDMELAQAILSLQ